MCVTRADYGTSGGTIRCDRGHGGLPDTEIRGLPNCADAGGYVPSVLMKDIEATRPLVRPREGRIVAGVCAGVADRFGLPRNLVRVLFVLSLLLPGPQILAYLLGWILIPDEPQVI
jgi:phage shock protein C